MIRTLCTRAPVGPRSAYHSRNLLVASPKGPQFARVRHNASLAPVAPKAPVTGQAIPGASRQWLEPLLEPFRAYGRAQRSKPYTTQVVSSLVIYFIGDLAAQSINKPKEEALVLEESAEKQGRDWARTGRALIIGGLSAIPAYKWFIFLGTNFNYSSRILSLGTKIVVNQAVFTPVFNTWFFGMQSLLSGATVSETLERIKNTVPKSTIDSCKVFPIVTAFSFTYVPMQFRSLFGGVVAIGWQTYLSLLNQRAAALERGKETVESRALLGPVVQPNGHEIEIVMPKYAV